MIRPIYTMKEMMVGRYANEMPQIPVHPHPNHPQQFMGAFNQVQQMHDPQALMYPNLPSGSIAQQVDYFCPISHFNSSF
jgi:hypothetical protein